MKEEEIDRSFFNNKSSTNEDDEDGRRFPHGKGNKMGGKEPNMASKCWSKIQDDLCPLLPDSN
jgi:hypothetical protein